MGEKLAHDLEWIADRSVAPLPPHCRRHRLARAQAVARRTRAARRLRFEPHVRNLRDRDDATAPRDVEALRAMSDLLVHRGPDSAGEHVDGGVAPRGTAPLDHRPRARRPADRERGRELRRRPERRDLQLPRSCARELERAGHRFAHTLRHRGARPPLRGARARLRASGCAGCSRWRSGTRGAAASCSRATAYGIKPLYYRHVGGELASPRSCGRCRAARSTSTRSRPSSPSTRSRRRYSIFRDVRKLPAGHVLVWEDGEVAARAVRAARAGGRGRAADGRRGGDRGGAAGEAARLGAGASPRGRSGRRPPLRRRRLRGARGARGAGDAGAGAHVHDRLRRAQLRRARRRAARRRALRDGPP